MLSEAPATANSGFEKKRLDRVAATHFASSVVTKVGDVQVEDRLGNAGAEERLSRERTAGLIMNSSTLALC